MWLYGDSRHSKPPLTADSAGAIVAAPGRSAASARKVAMHFRCIRTHENFPGRPGRLRFTVRCGLVIDPSELELLEKYGAPLLEALFTEPNAMAHLRSPEGITRPFETVDAALSF